MEGEKGVLKVRGFPCEVSRDHSVTKFEVGWPGCLLLATPRQTEIAILFHAKHGLF